MSQFVEKVFLNWSSGKDASMALNILTQDHSIDVKRLMTTVNAVNDRIDMHGLHISLLKSQAESLGLPLDILYLPKDMDNSTYQKIITDQLKSYQKEGINCAVYGDIFLQDLREYREKQLNSIGMKALFPLWNRSTLNLMQNFINSGFKAVVVSINAQKLDKSFCGRELDQSFLDDLPEDVDPCGENGEFHTFCYDGPIFSTPVPFNKKTKTYKTYPAPKGNKEGLKEYGFWFQEII